MTDPTLNIKIKADTSSAQTELNRFKTTFTEFGSALGILRSGFEAFRTVVATAFDMTKAHADLERTRGQLDNLAVSINTTTDSLLEGMTAASSGLMSNAEMISAATDIISLGLARNEEDVIRLATVVSELGWDMQQVILTFANDSANRLDALGLSVSDVTARAREFEAAGMEASQAFDQAVLAAAEAKIELVGSQADTAAGQIKRMEAAAADLRAELNALVASAMLPVIEGTMDYITAIKAIDEALRNQVTTTEEIDAMMMAVRGGTLSYTEMIEILTGRVEDYNREMGFEVERLGQVITATDQAMRMNEMLEASLVSAAAETEIMTDIMDGYGEAAEDAAVAVDGVTRAARSLSDTEEGIVGWFENTLKALQDFASPETILARDMAQQILDLFLQPDSPLSVSSAEAYITGFYEAVKNGTPVLETAGAAYLGMASPGGGLYEFQMTLDNARQQAIDLETALEGASGDWSATFNLTVTGDPVPSLDGLQKGGGQGGTGAIGFAEGASFMVPPGYPNDSFGPLYVQSGEHVQVTPAGQTPQGGGSGPVQVVVMLDGEQIAARVMTRAGRDVRQAEQTGAGYTGW